MPNIIEGIKNPKKGLKFILDGGEWGRTRKNLKIIKDYSNDYSTIKRMESFLGTELQDLFQELLEDGDYNDFQELLAKNLRNLGAPGFTEARMLYLIVRALRPRIVIETGVANGVTSTMILLALNKNKFGNLYSIDWSVNKIKSKRKATQLPSGKNIGWLVPDKLKERWVVSFGDAKILLPKLISEIKECDVFLHDSDHSYGHMMFEFETIYPVLKKILLSDDISRNNAFDEFSSRYDLKTLKVSRFGIMKIKSS